MQQQIPSEKEIIQTPEYRLEYLSIVAHARGECHCKTLEKFKTKSAAMKEKARIQTIETGRKLVYNCKFCGFWHCTHRPLIEEIQEYNNLPFRDRYQIDANYLTKCHSKHKFKTRLAAQTFINMVFSKPLTAYPCPSCGFWHIGTKRHEEKKDAPQV
jgi:predicted RNA-binding Zn-ribbon protein involved in translation (DUF1610 family)